MLTMLAAVSLLSFGLSFLFALGGVGSAVVLVPVLYWLGYPLNEAKPTGLFVNTVSLIGASYNNIRHGRLDFRLGIPIIVSSVIMAPVGAYASKLIPHTVVIGVFVAFLTFSGLMMLFFKSAKYKDRFREDRPVFSMIGIGALAGFISGLLGVGGGGLISPLMVMLGFNPKKIAAITAFVVPFSSLSGFITYTAMGHFDVMLVLPVGLMAYLGGYLGTRFMQHRLSPGTVKKILAVLVLLLGFKMLLKLLPV
ncbi:anion permease [Desulfonema ishimotonii]|uniref:Probable membrane transporter protein n=1 Tax=Desulfonema ishimotonii TaxID=45657 RepID=A0A401FSS1_9BACT|nr:sulfite exporter TauE/SafE family protein [Desulfonema ishimotonii]GBC60005.1 anion permease [Desulfonema ishimotonii]